MVTAYCSVPSTDETKDEADAAKQVAAHHGNPINLSPPARNDPD